MSPVHVVLTGVVAVAAPPGEAFELFTPEGERRWCDGWDPEWVEPSTGTLLPGAAFCTTHAGEETVWLVVDVDRAAGRVRYVRDTPGSRIGSVEVRCAPAPGGGTVARVTYDLTALSPAGQEYLAEFEPGYAEMLASWERDIAQALERERRAREPPP
jgi:hypothetical protein